MVTIPINYGGRNLVEFISLAAWAAGNAFAWGGDIIPRCPHTAIRSVAAGYTPRAVAARRCNQHRRLQYGKSRISPMPWDDVMVWRHGLGYAGTTP